MIRPMRAPRLKWRAATGPSFRLFLPPAHPGQDSLGSGLSQWVQRGLVLELLREVDPQSISTSDGSCQPMLLTSGQCLSEMAYRWRRT